MDKNKVKIILTMKSGQFIFSSKYSEEKLIEILIQSRILYRTISDMPILPDLASQIEEDIIIKSIFSTAAIEGNQLSEERVAEIVKKPPGKETAQRAEKEIRNLKQAYDIIKSFQPTQSPILLEEETIKEIHAIVTQDIEHPHNIPGQYRNHTVEVGNEEHGGIYRPPKILKDIESLMKEFIAWINSEEILQLDPVLRSSLAHYHLGLIHPFSDGNGRTARIIEAMMLQSRGFRFVPVMLSNYYYRNINDYFRAFSYSIHGEDHDVTPFLEFTASGFLHSLNTIRGIIFYFIRRFALQDYYRHMKKNRKISQRQLDLLNMLLDHHRSITIPDLFNTSPFDVLYRKASERTARRDLKKLLDENLLTLNDKKYELNLRALEK